MTDHVTGLVCVICGTAYPADEAGYVCPDHGNEGILDVRYDYDLVGSRISKQSLRESVTRPCGGTGHSCRWQPTPTSRRSPSGGTPTYDAPRLAKALGLGQVWVKDEGRQPTASLKDRASAMAIVKAMEIGAEVVTTASTGNAAAALSGLSASVGQKNVIFVPETAPQAKIAQLLAYGSTVALVKGTYGDAFDLCMEAAAEFGWYNRNTGFNPYMTEGKKTAGLEILEQLDWNVPDAIFVSVGDGSIIGGVHKAMKDALALGWIDRSPRIFGIQSAGSDYLVQAFESRRGCADQAAHLGRHDCRLNQRRPSPRPHQSDGRRHRDRRGLPAGERRGHPGGHPHPGAWVGRLRRAGRGSSLCRPGGRG